MIQRIQTVFLLLATALISSMFLLPLGELVSADIVYTLKPYGIYDGEGVFAAGTIPFLILNILVPIISLISIFLYKNRNLQMRVCRFNIILTTGLVAFILFYLLSAAKQLDSAVHYSIASIFPVLAVILTLMAHRAIKKDDKLVRSMDRIR